MDSYTNVIYIYVVSIYCCIYIYGLLQYICSRFPVRWPPRPNNPPVPSLFPSQNLPFACYLQHLRVIESQLHAICSISEPQPANCTLFAVFESHMLPTYHLRAVHIVTYCIYMPLFYLVYLYASHSVSIYYSSVAYDWCIKSAISIHRPYIVLVA